jgi:hypothetical protein
MTVILTNIIATLVILAIVGGASYYIYKEKKKGTKCIGCPMAGNCAKAKAQMGCCSSGKHQK